MIWYKFLDYFFFFFHTSITMFNIIGWMFPKTRKINLVTLLLTAFSWFGLGIWYGWGYCVCTDWHWDVRGYLGYDDKSNSYIHFLILKLTDINLKPQLVDKVVLIVFLLSLVMSIWLNVRDWRRKKKIYAE